MISTEQYRTIYEMLDRVNPVPYDCGASCASVCCRDDSFVSGEEPYIYLLPGEKEYLESAGCTMKIIRQMRREHDLPATYGKYVYLLCCSGPESCDRRFRPIQCRTFPLTPHIKKSGELTMIYYDEDLPYVCPLIKEKTALSGDFVRVTQEAWNMLIEDDAIRDLVIYDSGRRDIAVSVPKRRIK